VARWYLVRVAVPRSDLSDVVDAIIHNKLGEIICKDEAAPTIGRDGVLEPQVQLVIRPLSNPSSGALIPLVRELAYHRFTSITIDQYFSMHRTLKAPVARASQRRKRRKG
jgi:hypothetical protein